MGFFYETPYHKKIGFNAEAANWLLRQLRAIQEYPGDLGLEDPQFILGELDPVYWKKRLILWWQGRTSEEKIFSLMEKKRLFYYMKLILENIGNEVGIKRVRKMEKEFIVLYEPTNPPDVSYYEEY